MKDPIQKRVLELARTDRGQAVKLSQQLLDGPEAYASLTPKDVYKLVEGVFAMDRALKEIAGIAK